MYILTEEIIVKEQRNIFKIKNFRDNKNEYVALDFLKDIFQR